MATLTVQIKETLNLNGKEQGSVNTKTISDITQVLKTIVEVPTSEINLLTFASAATGVTTLDQDDVEYIRITNLDANNYITIGIEKESSTTEHPQFFTSDAAHDSSATQIDIETITALANGGACKLELFVALNTTT